MTEAFFDFWQKGSPCYSQGKPDFSLAAAILDCSYRPVLLDRIPPLPSYLSAAIRHRSHISSPTGLGLSRIPRKSLSDVERGC